MLHQMRRKATPFLTIVASLEPSSSEEEQDHEDEVEEEQAEDEEA